ncbi:lectin [Actinokineospora soli]
MSGKTSAALVAAAITGAALAATTTPASAADTAYDVLVFSKTVGFRHDAIPAGTQAIRELGAANNFTVTATEDASVFNATSLSKYEAVVFLLTTGDVLDAAQQTAFENYIRAGGGYLGVHSAADTEYNWPFYGELVGAYFSAHPAIQQARVTVENRGTAATAGLPKVWTRTDEWYDYRTNPRSTAKVLASLDPTSYSGHTMGADHPHVWCKNHQGGRSFYIGGGHTAASYGETGFRGLLLGGIRYAGGRTKIDCRPETGYTTLYDGATTGWSQAGPGGFTNSDNTLTSSGGLGLYWYSAKQYTSYSLKLDWMMPGDDNSGVFIGFPPSNDPWSAVDNGYEIQIDATDGPAHTTGAVYGFKAPDAAARDAALNPPGEWNEYELLVEGERLRIYLNGVLVNDFTNTDPARSLAGHIGLQNHGTGDDVSFRNIRIKELGGAGQQTVQAESFSSASGVQPFTKAGANNGQTLGYIDPGDWAAYNGVDLTGAGTFKARVVSGGAGGNIQVRTGSPTGPVLGTVAVPNTGGWNTFADVQTTLANVPTGPQNLHLTFTGTGTGLFDVDDFTLVRTATPGRGPIVGVASGKCVDVAGGATADGTRVQLLSCNGSAAQTWSRVGQTWQALGKCLDVSGGSTADGAVVQLWTCNGSGAQNWTAQSGGGLVNPQSAKCLDASGGGTADGTRLIIWSCHGGANQRWTLPQ